MTQTKQFVDVEGPVKAWLRAQNIAGVDQRVYIGTPEGAQMPYVTLTLVDAPLDTSEAPVAMAQLQCDVWATTAEAAADAVWSLVSKCESIADGTQLDSTLRCCGARRILGPTFRPDPTDGTPRYLTDIEFTVIAR